MWDLVFPTRAQTHIPYIGRQILYHWTWWLTQSPAPSSLCRSRSGGGWKFQQSYHSGDSKSFKSSLPGMGAGWEGWAQFITSVSSWPPNHLVLCCPLLLLPSIFPTIRAFSKLIGTSGGHSIGASASILPINIQLISFRTDWFDLLAGESISQLFFNSRLFPVHLEEFTE